ncbi:hypothetical protein LV779_15935 [Streptomyces thinghirensis]|nr:hypothetical protein [Streptomyces thinghirensis]
MASPSLSARRTATATVAALVAGSPQAPRPSPRPPSSARTTVGPGAARIVGAGDFVPAVPERQRCTLLQLTRPPRTAPRARATAARRRAGTVRISHHSADQNVTYAFDGQVGVLGHRPEHGDGHGSITKVSH